MRKSEEGDWETTSVVPSVHLERAKEHQPKSTEQQDRVAIPGMVEADADTLNVPQGSPARPRVGLDNSRKSAPCVSAHLSAHRISAQRLSAQHRLSVQLSAQCQPLYSADAAAGLQRPSLSTAQMPHHAEELFGLVMDSTDREDLTIPMKASARNSLLPKGIGVPIFLCALFSFMNNWPPSCH